jgi:ubiquinone/menaquinone biosynthesis C-methylase UbiE
MADLSDQQYLLQSQYKDASNLKARIQLHIRFSQNHFDWQRWVFDHLNIQPSSAILELGCGPGNLWVNNLDRIPVNWKITLSDFSPGMLREAQQNLQNSEHPFTYRIIDAQSIPLEDQSLDIVIANHMLYHVPDRAKALAEIRRVLKPGGRFYAATNTQDYMQELDELIRPFVDPSPKESMSRVAFSLESGAAELAQWFTHVEAYRNIDQLVVTETEPLMAYILSGYLKAVMAREKVAALRALIEQSIASEGAIRINKISGLFEAYGVK